MDPVLKVRCTLDAQFGAGASGRLPSDLSIGYSKRTGRIKTIHDGGGLLGTLRTDGGLAITIRLAQLLVGRRGFDSYCVEVTSEAAPFVAQGRSVFCRHVARCGRNVRVGSDVPVLFERRVIAVGRAVLACEAISDMDRGVAVRVRNSLKSCDGDDWHDAGRRKPFGSADDREDGHRHEGDEQRAGGNDQDRQEGDRN